MAIFQREIRYFIMLALQLKERQNIGLRRVEGGWSGERKGCCGGLREVQSQRRCIGCGVSKLVVAVAVVEAFCASREAREERYRTSPSSRSPHSPPPPRPYSCHPRHPLWTFDRSHSRCLPSGAQSRATTEIRLAIIADDKVEQCRTPVSRRTSVQEEEEKEG